MMSEILYLAFFCYVLFSLLFSFFCFKIIQWAVRIHLGVSFFLLVRVGVFFPFVHTHFSRISFGIRLVVYLVIWRILVRMK